MQWSDFVRNAIRDFSDVFVSLLLFVWADAIIIVGVYFNQEESV